MSARHLLNARAEGIRTLRPFTPDGDLFSSPDSVLATFQEGTARHLEGPNGLTPGELKQVLAGMPRLVDNLRAALLQIGKVGSLEELGTAGPLNASGGKDSLFCALFGRDSEKIARHVQFAYPEVGRQTILKLGALQGINSDARSDEEPGRILHEYRPKGDPIGDNELAPKWGELPYYGTIDATPNFVNLVSEYVEQNGPGILSERMTRRDGRQVTVAQAVESASRWLERRLDVSVGDGMLWVQRSQRLGIPFQSWIDAADSRFDETGKLLDQDRPHIPLQDQGFAYRALRNAASLAHASGNDARGEELDERAAALRKKVLENFWLDDLGVFAPTLVQTEDGHWRPLRIVSSEAWALLDSRLLDGDDAAPKRERLIQNLVSPQLRMLAKGGVRTKSAVQEYNARYNPRSYQNGSSWPHDTKEILDGLRRYGYDRLAADLELRILLSCIADMKPEEEEQATGPSGRGFPEYVQGLDDGVPVNRKVVDIVEPDGFHNRVEQPPQDPQGWTASAVFGILYGNGIIDRDLNFDAAALERFKRTYADFFDPVQQGPGAA